MKALFAAATFAAASLATLAIAQDYPAQPPPAQQPPEAAAPPTAQQPPPATSPTAPAPPPAAQAPAPSGAMASAQLSGTIEDAKATYSEAQVRPARRAYRAACQRYESRGFCDCVTAGVAQALPPSTVRMAASDIGERITAQGSASGGYETDARIGADNPQERIAQVEGHYADACQQLRR